MKQLKLPRAKKGDELYIKGTILGHGFNASTYVCYEGPVGNNYVCSLCGKNTHKLFLYKGACVCRFCVGGTNIGIEISPEQTLLQALHMNKKVFKNSKYDEETKNKYKVDYYRWVISLMDKIQVRFDNVDKRYRMLDRG